MRKVFLLIVCTTLSLFLKGQELYNLTLPASTLPKGAVGVRLFNESYSEQGLIRKITEMKLMYGITSKFSVTLSAVASDYHSLYLPLDFILHDHSGGGAPPSANLPQATPNPYIFAGADLYAQYRFFSSDGQNSHFRMAAYGEGSYIRIASHLGEPELLTHNTGFGAGIITTYLKSRFAGTITLGGVVPTEYQGNAFDRYGGTYYTTIKYGNAFNYDFALGYLLFPRHYKSYEQTNVNLYLEFLGRSYGAAQVTQQDGVITDHIPNTPFLNAGNYVDINPGVQWIIKSTLRIDVSVGFPLINSSFIHQYPLYYIGLQRYFFLRNVVPQKVINFDTMKTLVTITVIFLTGIIIAGGCKPKSGNTITGGGKGGTYTINVTGEHHGGLLDTCMMYIKYGTLDAPSNNLYDDSESVTLSNGVPVASFSNLTQGNYYVLAIGYHGGYSPPNVKGAKSFVVSGSPQVVSDTIPTYQYNP